MGTEVVNDQVWAFDRLLLLTQDFQVHCSVNFLVEIQVHKLVDRKSEAGCSRLLMTVKIVPLRIFVEQE